MHEMSIANEVLGQLEALAAENHLARIESFTLRAGVLRGIVPEALQIAWASLAEGTLAEGAELKLEVVEAQARCQACGLTYQPTIDCYLCPRCNQARPELLSGNEILLTRVTGTEET